jgi:hypothetical protein
MTDTDILARVRFASELYWFVMLQDHVVREEPGNGDFRQARRGKENRCSEANSDGLSDRGIHGIRESREIPKAN